MATDEERLIVLLEARIRDYEKNLQKASKTTGREFGEMRGHSRSATRDMERDMQRSTSRINQALASTGRHIGALAATMAAPIAAVGVAGLTVGLTNAARSMAMVGDEAKRAGIGIREFQELQYVAEQNRIAVDSLTDGLKEMNLRADEFIVTGKGPAAEAFSRLGYTAEDLTRKLERPSDLFLEIIGRLEQLDRAAQIRIADEIFGGTGGERFVQIIERGEEAIRDTIDEAHELGLVMSDELIDRADELDRKFNAVKNTVGTGLKRAIVEASTALGAFIDEFKRVEARTTENLRSRLEFAERNLSEAKGRKTEGAGWFTGALDQQIEKSQAEVDQLRAELERRDGLTRQRNQLENPIVPIDISDDEKSDRSVEKLQRERDAVRELIAEMEQELSLVHATDEAKRAAEASRMAGAAATDKERLQIIALNEAIHDEREAFERAAETQEFFTDMAMDGFYDLAGAIDTGSDSLDRMLGTLMQAVAQAALLGEGPLAGLFGGGGLSLGGGASSDPWAGMRKTGGGGFWGNIGSAIGSFLGMAGGGRVSGPGTGTSDSIPTMLSDGEFIVNAKATRKNRGILEAINSGMDLQHLSIGGIAVPTGEAGAELVLRSAK